MAKRFDALTDKHIDFIQQQQLYFIATAGASGYVNVSPKGVDTLRVIDQTRVSWLNLTGSGNESAAHVLENQRMTIMFCSFSRQPSILRLYGNARVVHTRDAGWDELYARFDDYLGARQIFELELTLVQTSCGFGVPEFEFKGQRTTMQNWAEKNDKDGFEHYWKEQNQLSLDGKKTGII